MTSKLPVLVGVSEQDLQTITTALRSVLNRIPGRTGRVEAFGSRVKGNFRKDSDLDLWLALHPALLPSERSELRERFEESDLPFSIDLIDSATAPEWIHSSIASQPASERALLVAFPHES